MTATGMILALPRTRIDTRNVRGKEPICSSRRVNPALRCVELAGLTWKQPDQWIGRAS